MSNKIFVSLVRTSSFPKLEFTFVPSILLTRKGDKPYIVTYGLLPKKVVISWLCGVRDEVKTGWCTLGASVPLFIMVAKWIRIRRRVPLFPANITESLPTPRTVRISAMVEKKLMAHTALLLIIVSRK
jgi:hypothetical protein